MQNRRPRGPTYAGDPVPRWTARRRPETPRSYRVQALGLLVVLATAALLIFHGLALATAPDNARRSLRASLPALTDLDQALAAHEADVRTAPAGGGNVVVPGLPVAVQVSPEVAQQGGAELRRAVIDAMARAVYRDGFRVFRESDTSAVEAPGLFTQLRAVQRSLALLTERTHQRFALLRVVALAVALGLAALLALQVEGRRRALAVGSAVAGGAVLASLGVLLGRATVWLLFSEDADITASVIARIAGDLTTTVIAVAATAVIAAVLVVVAGALVPRLTAARLPANAETSPWPKRGNRTEYWEES